MSGRGPWVRDAAAAGTAAAVLGLVSTVGDWIWSRYLTDGAILPGVLHGLVFFVVLALVLGGAAGGGRVRWRLLATLPAAGLVIAAAFYPVARVVGYLGALLVTWVAMWLALALLLRWAREGDESVGRALARGALAAVGSGLAFWSVAKLWTDPGFATSYVVRFLCWAWAFLPGCVALLWGRVPGVRSAP